MIHRQSNHQSSTYFLNLIFRPSQVNFQSSKIHFIVNFLLIIAFSKKNLSLFLNFNQFLEFIPWHLPLFVFKIYFPLLLVTMISSHCLYPRSRNKVVSFANMYLVWILFLLNIDWFPFYQFHITSI